MFSPEDYASIFNARADAYHEAMRRWPDARDAEFTTLFKGMSLKTGMHVIDVPSGGGYLARYLPNDVSLHHLETSELFARLFEEEAHSGSIHPLSLCELEKLPEPDNSTDLACSLAGLHHIEDKTPLFKELFRVLKPGGVTRIADAHSDSATAAFLDGWMGNHNSMGHHGWYLNESTLDTLREIGFTDVTAVNEEYHWVFNSEQEAAAYCKRLFGIDLASTEETEATIRELLGFDTLENGQVGMRWSLYYLSAYKPV
ncbi:MAG: class I SAM-dependent methyltransferase [Pseudomonadota bacterium]|nr:class I SAM-dependent methyltransferase [Pseudomonadota bacterium]